MALDNAPSVVAPGCWRCDGKRPAQMRDPLIPGGSENLNSPLRLCIPCGGERLGVKIAYETLDKGFVPNRPAGDFV